MALLSDRDKKRIEQTIAAVEKKTAGEVVVAVVPRSAPYELARAAIAVDLALALAWAAAWLWPQLPAWAVVLAQIPVALAGWFGLARGAVLRRILPPAYQVQAVHNRALRLFAERNVFGTRDRSGLLVMVSELERRAVILGDAGIHAHIGDSGWQQHVRTIVEGVRQKQAAAAIIRVLEELGTVLAEHFPPRADDVNELPDTVIEED